MTSASLPAGTINAYYSQALTASDGTSPYTWSLAGGSQLPAGLNGTLSWYNQRRACRLQVLIASRYSLRTARTLSRRQWQRFHSALPQVLP